LPENPLQLLLAAFIQPQNMGDPHSKP